MAASIAAARAGVSRVAEHPFMIGADGEPIRGALCSELDPVSFGATRVVALGSRGLSAVLADVPTAGHPVPLLLSMPELRPGWTEADDRIVITKLVAVAAELGHQLVPRVVARGHAGGLAALRSARASMAQATDVCLVAGLDSYWHPDTIDHLIATRQLASAQTRGAFLPGEGAGFLLVGTPTARSFLRLPAVARFAGVGVADEPNTYDSNRENLGRGMTKAVKDALSEAGGKPSIAGVLCDINGQRHRSEELGFVALRLSQTGVQFSDYLAPTDAWGDLGAATGPFLVSAAAQGWARHYRPNRPVLVMTGSMGPLRSAAVLEPGSSR